MKNTQSWNYNQLLFDTCVLFDLLLYNYSNTLNNNSKKSEYHKMIFKNGPISKNHYINFFNNITKINTSPHVIGELYGLINSKLHLKGDLYSQFWKFSLRYLKSKQLNEDLIQLMSVIERENFLDIALKIGYIDTGLIEIAKKNNNFWVVTIDKETLQKYAVGMGVKVFDPRFHEIESK